MDFKTAILLSAAVFAIVAAPTAAADPTDDPVGYAQDVADWALSPEGGECIENPLGGPKICWKP